MRRQRDILFGAVLGAVVGVVGLRVAPGVAQSIDTATDNLPRVIAYDGTLAFEGEEVDGAVDLRFALYDKDDFALWSEELEDVAVADGRFSVLLGEESSLSAAVLQSGSIYLGVEMKPEGTSDWIALEGRQMLAAAPRAMWAANASDLTTSGSLTVAGAASFTATSTATALGDLVIPKAAATFSLGSTGGPHGIAFADPGEAGAQLVFRTSANKLVLEGTNDLSDGTDVFAAATSDGSVVTTGAGDLDGTVQVNGGDLTVSPSASGTGLSLSGDILLGVDAAAFKGVAFADNTTNDTTAGMQFSYNHTFNGLALEAKANLTDNPDLWYIDDGGEMYVKGNFEVAGIVVEDETFSATTDVEAGDGNDNTSDKDFYDDSSCTTGMLAAGINQDGQANICVCMDGERTQGWYCWN